MSFNSINTTGLKSTISYHFTNSNASGQEFRLSTDTANNLGYGIGRAIRIAFDSLWNAWGMSSTPEPSPDEIAWQRNTMIYQGGLKECVKRLGPALANLQMNPNDRGALKKVEQLSAHFADYLRPNRQGHLLELQNKLLRPLEERVSTAAHPHIKNALSKCMPLFFRGNNSAQTERHQAYMRPSQLMQELAEAKFASIPMEKATDPQEIDRSQLIDGGVSVLRSLDAGLLRFLSILPGVSAGSVNFDKLEVTIPEEDDHNGETNQPDESYIAYITCAEGYNLDGTIIAINTETHKVVAKIEVEAQPVAFAFTPNSSYVFVTNALSSSISIIDTYSNTVSTRFVTPFIPSGITITPDGLYAYIISLRSPEIYILKTSNNEFEKKAIPTSCTHWVSAMTPNGQYVYATCFNSSHVSVIETANNTLLTTIPVGEFPIGLAISSNGRYAYVANADSLSVSVINTTNHKVIATIPLKDFPEMVAITPDDQYVYVASAANGTVSVIETVNYTVLTTIPVGGHPFGVAITPDGQYAYVTNYNNFTSVINTTSLEVITTIDIGCHGDPTVIAITPTKIRISKDLGLIIGLTSAGGIALISLVAAGSFLAYRRFRKEENPSELNSLINPLSVEQKMDLM